MTTVSGAVCGAALTPGLSRSVSHLRSGQGIVNGDTGVLVAALPGVDDVAVRSGGGLWATTGAGEDPEADTGQAIWRISGGEATLVANLFEYEKKVNPHPETVDSNPFDVADAGGGKALVADAGGNGVLLVGDGNSPNSDVASRVKLVATLPDELVSTANAKTIFGCPNGPPDIGNLPPVIPAQAAATSVAVGPDGAYYVGELKGFPAPTGESRVWRIEPGARNVRCGESTKCTLVLDGFTSIIDLAFGPDGRLNVAQIDDASWLAMEVGVGPGGSVRSCNLATDHWPRLRRAVARARALARRAADDLRTQGASVRRRGTRHRGARSCDAHLLDIAPTVLEVLGIEREPGMRGKSLLPALAAR